YNHIGTLAAGGEALAKSLLIGGVTRRFPTLKVAFLEGGVGWAVRLFADILGHWEKRNTRTIYNMDPERLDRAEVMRYMEKYGDPRVAANLDKVRAFLNREEPHPPS